ncbi:LOW QUALITY PROTEIN: AT-rich interactive domain-containing protein 4A-like [Sarcophilus harrisii]
MEETAKVEQEMPEVKSEPEENIDSDSDSEKKEIELMCLRSRRRIARALTPAKKENEEEKIEDKLSDYKEEEKSREKYDEWTKDQWPLDKGGPKRKQKKKTKKKEDSKKDEKKDEERQKSKCGLPPLTSTLPSNMSYGVSKTPNIEGKVGALTARSTLPDSSLPTNGMEGPATSDKNLMNEEFSPEILEELEKSEKFIDDKMEEENPKFPHVLKENDRTQVQSLETLKLEIEESEQIGQIFENKMEQAEEIKKKPKKSRKAKGRKNKAKDLSSKIVKISPLCQDEARSESYIGHVGLKSSSLKSKDFPSTTKDEKDSCSKEKNLKRKLPGQSSPKKKIRIETEMEVPDFVSAKRTGDSIISEEFKELNSEEQPEIEHEEMPSLIAESEPSVQDLATENSNFPNAEERENVVVEEEEEDIMPLIGPETLVCREVDLDDLDENDKNSADGVGTDIPDPVSPVPNPPALPPAAPPAFSAASPLALSQEESQSTKSESDTTIEVDREAKESQEGLCDSESANGLEAGTTSGTCSVIVREKEIRDKGQKRKNDGNGGSLPKKQKRPPKRTSATIKNEKNGAGQSSDLPVPASTSKCTPVEPPKLAPSPARMMSPPIKDGDKDEYQDKHQNSSPRTYKWSFQLNELDNMNSAERISFLQETLQDIRKCYMSLKSEVAAIDRRKRLKKKAKLVSHAKPKMPSASSKIRMSPSSSSSSS